MKKNLVLLSIAVLLCACGQVSSSTSVPNGEVTTSQGGETTTSVVTGDNGMSLRMFGDLYPDAARAIYAEIENYQGQEIVWTSSNPSVIGASVRDDLTTECMLVCKGVGEATITAYLADNPSVKASKDFVITRGEAMSKELFKQVTGGLKLTSSDKCLSYDNKFNATVDLEYTLETVYEETNPSEAENNTTDAYQLTVTNNKTNRSSQYTYVKGVGGYVATECIDEQNQVQSERYLNSEGEGMKWDYSYYSNLWGNTDVVTNENFVTYDGGKTYHYASSYISSMYLCISMYLLDAAPDDIWLVVEDGAIKEIHVDIDPYSSDPKVARTGRQIVSTISEVNKAKIEHLKPYERKDIHNTIDDAKNKMASLKNYKSRITVDDPTSYNYYYDFTFTEDTIDIKSYCDDELIAHSGVHKQSNTSYYTYVCNNNEVTIDKMYNAAWESENVTRYPTFGFASEIFEKSINNKYVTIGNQNKFVAYCGYLSNLFSMATYDGKGYLELNSDNYVSKITSTINVMGDDIGLTIEYSDYNKAVCDIDFSGIGADTNLPTSFAQSDPSLYNNLVAWGLDDVVPYLYSSTGYATSVFHTKTDDYTGILYAYIKTNELENADARSAFIEDYKGLLVANGYTLTDEVLTITKSGVTQESYLYERGNYKIAVAPELNWNGKEKNSVTIYIVSDLLVVVD